MIASVIVPAGTYRMSRRGEMSAPSQVYLTGITAPSAKAGVEIVITAGGWVDVVICSTVVVVAGGGGVVVVVSSLAPGPHAEKSFRSATS